MLQIAAAGNMMSLKNLVGLTLDGVLEPSAFPFRLVAQRAHRRPVRFLVAKSIEVVGGGPIGFPRHSGDDGEFFEPLGKIPLFAAQGRKHLAGGPTDVPCILLLIMGRELESAHFPIHAIRMRILTHHAVPWPGLCVLQGHGAEMGCQRLSHRGIHLV